MQRKVVMLKLRAAIIGVTTTFTLSTSAGAGLTSYTCTIEGFNTIAPESNQWLLEESQSETIQVDRRTGQVYHSRLGNSMMRNIYLLNEGDGDWSFKVFADSGRGPNNIAGGSTHYFQVDEFIQSFTKPFIAVSNGMAFWGSCT